MIGNPPFLGDKFMRDRLGSDYTEALRAAYSGRVPDGADLVCYWFGKACEAIENGMLDRIRNTYVSGDPGAGRRIEQIAPDRPQP